MLGAFDGKGFNRPTCRFQSQSRLFIDCLKYCRDTGVRPGQMIRHEVETNFENCGQSGSIDKRPVDDTPEIPGLPLYASVGIREVWIEDLKNNRLLVFRDPAGKAYSTAHVVGRGESVSPLAFPDVTISIDELLGL